MKDRLNLQVFMTPYLAKVFTKLSKSAAKYLRFMTEYLIPLIGDNLAKTRFHEALVRFNHGKAYLDKEDDGYKQWMEA